MNNYICHHGIKGMKWGVRRYQNPDGTLTPVGKKRQQKEQKKWDKNVQNNWTKAHNKAVAKINSRMSDFNNEWEKKIDFGDTKSEGYKQYVKAYCDMWNDVYTKELDAMFGKGPIDTGREWCDTVPMFMNAEDLYD